MTCIRRHQKVTLIVAFCKCSIDWSWRSSPCNADRTQIGTSVHPVTALVPGIVLSVSVSGSSSCAVVQNGTVHCWGYNGNGQLGYGATGGASAFSTPRRVYTSVLTPWGVGIGTARASDIDCGEDIGTCTGLVCDDATARCKAANVSDGFGCALPGSTASAKCATGGCAAVP